MKKEEVDGQVLALAGLPVKVMEGYRVMLGLCPGHWLAEPFAVMGSIGEEA